LPCPAEVPGIHELLSALGEKIVDGRDKPGHDEANVRLRPACGEVKGLEQLQKENRPSRGRAVRGWQSWVVGSLI
jgi:hypothetical protein